MHDPARRFTISTMPEYDRKCADLITEADAKNIRDYLHDNPTAGDVIPKSGGMRKLRWGAGARGKRGGVRVVYCFRPHLQILRLVAMYGKSEKENLTPKQLKIISTRIKDIL